MMKKTYRTVFQRMIPAFVAGAAIATVACSDSMTGITEEDALLSEVVLTQGTPAPEHGLSPEGPRRSDLAGSAPSELGGSTTSPVSLKPSSCVSGSSQQVTITYSITGRQVNPASFKVNTVWTYNGTGWGSATPTTVNVPARAASDAATVREIDITVANGSSANSGTSSFSIVPFDVSTTAPAALSVAAGDVTVNVAFVPCPSTNTPPTLVLPTFTLSVEATSSAGAAFDPLAYATANDLEDGDLTASVICAPVAGTFALGTHTFDCEVEDSGGLKTTGSFDILVEDTTPAGFTSIPSGTVSKIAQSVSGWTFDAGAFGITVADVGGVSEPSTFSCTPANGTALAIGSTTTVSCKAKDAIGNEQATATAFNVFVTLDLSSIGGFLTPLRNVPPFSAHKRGSTIPHKFLPPLYSDGTPATDLASGLGLRLWWKSGESLAGVEEAFDPAAGSTSWRYDDGHYVFNAKTANNWKPGVWGTEVKFAGIVLATTDFGLLK